MLVPAAKIYFQVVVAETREHGLQRNHLAGTCENVGHAVDVTVDPPIGKLGAQILPRQIEQLERSGLAAAKYDGVILLGQQPDRTLPMFAVDRGFMDDVEMTKIGSFEGALIDSMKATQGELMESLNSGAWNDEVEGQLKAAVEEFKASGSW